MLIRPHRESLRGRTQEGEKETRGAEKQNTVMGKKITIANVLSAAFFTVLLAAQSFSLSTYPFIPDSALTAVRLPCTVALIDDLIWELT